MARPRRRGGGEARPQWPSLPRQPYPHHRLQPSLPRREEPEEDEAPAASNGAGIFVISGGDEDITAYGIYGARARSLTCWPRATKKSRLRQADVRQAARAGWQAPCQRGSL